MGTWLAFKGGDGVANLSTRLAARGVQPGASRAAQLLGRGARFTGPLARGAGVIAAKALSIKQAYDGFSEISQGMKPAGELLDNSHLSAKQRENLEAEAGRHYINGTLNVVGGAEGTFGKGPGTAIAVVTGFVAHLHDKGAEHAPALVRPLDRAAGRFLVGRMRDGNHLADWMTGQDLERRAGRGDGANPESDMSRHLGQQMRRNRGRDGIPRFIDKEREGRERHALVERWQKAHPGGRAATYPEQLVRAGRLAGGPAAAAPAAVAA